MKKKAIKIATASVVAASSFAAVAPFSTEAASSVPSTVAKAVKSMKAAKTAYKSLGDKGKVASVASVQKAVNQAKADYSKAKAALAKYKGKDKSKLNKQLMAAMKDYHNATDYIKAVNYASGLKKQADSFAAAAKAGKSINASDYAKFKAELAKATKKVMDQIVGLADKAVVKAYITPALSAAKTVDSYLVSVKSVDEVAAVTVDEGSKLEDVKLPKEVTVTLVNGKKAQKAVTWDTKELEANLSKPGDYTVKGAVADTKLEASVKVTVNAVNPKVESVSAINAKSLEVKFNKSVDDTKAQLEVKKGSVKVNYSKITWNADKTAATIELSGKLTAGEYTVNVTGLTEGTLTASTTVEDEKVNSVKILSENAVLNNAKTEVTVGYKVENQYGEDITENTSLVASAGGAVVNTSGTVTATKGQVTIPVTNASVKEGDSIVLTLVHTATGKAASQVVKVSSASAVTDVAITGIYNKDGKTLNEKSDLSKDAFYLLVEGKDQYGQAVKADALNGLLINNTNPLIAKVGNTFETIKVNGKDVTALRLTGPVSAGETNVMLISPSSGKNASYAVKVAEAQRSNTVTFDVPELVVANEDLFIPIHAYDKDGTEITDVKTLTEGTGKLTVSGATGVTVVKEDGKIGIKVTKGNVSEGYLSLVAVTSTGKSTIANIQVKAEAKPTVIRGLATNVSSVLLSDKNISKSDLAVEDQYGRVIKSSGLTLAANDGSANGTYRIAVTDKSDSNVITNNTTQFVYNSGNITLTKGTVNGSEKVEFKLQVKKDGAWVDVPNSIQTVDFRGTDGTEYASYQVDDLGTIFDEVGAGLTDNSMYDKELTVYGVLDDGKKVELTPSQYSVSAPSYLDYNGNGKFVLDGDGNSTPASDVPYTKDANEYKANVVVTINATGQQFTKEITISKVKPTVKELKVVKQGTGSTVAESLTNFNSATEVTSVDALDITSTRATDLVDFAVIDSYGAIHKSLDGTIAGNYVSAIKLVAVPTIPYSVQISNNNSNTLQFAELEAGEKINVTATVDGVSKSFTINGTVDTAANVADAANSLAITYAAGDSATSVTKALTLPTTGANGTTVSWSSSNTDVIKNNGTVIQPADADATVKLTATITKGSAKTTKQFTVVVKKADSGS